jgi:hypothetical protein
LSVIILLAGVVAGSIGALLFSPDSIAIATVLISTPWIQRIVDDMLIDKWTQVAIMFCLVAAYTSACIWAIALYIDISTFQERAELSLIATGAGLIQLAWKFLIAI